MFCEIVCPGKDCPKDCDHRAVAKRLEALTGGAARVLFAPNTLTDGDEGALGHLYSGSLDSDEDFLYLNDRGPESLEVQLVAELRRLGDHCHELANSAEARQKEEVAVA